MKSKSEQREIEKYLKELSKAYTKIDLLKAQIKQLKNERKKQS